MQGNTQFHLIPGICRAPQHAATDRSWQNPGADRYCQEFQLSHTKWEHSMNSEQSNLILAQRCMYLLLFDSKGLDWRPIAVAGPYDRIRLAPPPDLFDYASRYWPNNFGLSYLDDDTVRLWHDVCDTSSSRFNRWFSRYDSRKHNVFRLFRRFKNRSLSRHLQPNSGGFNKLVLATIFQHEHLVEMLVKADLRLNLQGHNGWTVLCLAIDAPSPAIMIILLNAGAQANVRDDSGRGFLYYVFRLSLMTLIGKFLIRSLKIDPANLGVRFLNRRAESLPPGRTLFHYIAARGLYDRLQEEIIHILLKAGLDPNARDWQGQKPLQLFWPALSYRDSEAYKILKRVTSRNVLLESKFRYDLSVLAILTIITLFNWLQAWGTVGYYQIFVFVLLAISLRPAYGTFGLIEVVQKRFGIGRRRNLLGLKTLT